MTTTANGQPADADELASPLELAQTWARRVLAIATHYEERERADPGFGRIEAHIHQAGRAQFEAAQMAAFMAVVSIADDLHAIRELLGAQASSSANATGTAAAQ